MLRETFLRKHHRDARYKALKAQGMKVYRRTARNQRLHPEYILDAIGEGITYETGFGNTDYLRTWGTLYIVESV